MADLAEQLGLSREIADRVVTWRHGRYALERDAAMGRPQAVKPAERGRHADRAAGIAAECEVAHLGRDRRGRAARRAAGDAIRRAGIHRLAVMGVPAEHAVEELVANGDPGT